MLEAAGAEKYMNQVVKVSPVKWPEAANFFSRCAKDYYWLKQKFQSPGRFSPVPYFLLCRAIELGIKARHLRTLKQSEVKKRFWHHLVRAYKDLDRHDQILSSSEFAVLKIAEDIYNEDKGFTYFSPNALITGFRRYPKLQELDCVAKKLIGLDRAK